ncbi:hypothetical protein cce_4879 [Crocosphaera subtropica ATCC 51142]|uniref:Uncharacterized protein n=1 Tax=Crocosphaera subtropica (strain ATCC 51142 / BH68) TaxID=43989 RepID=B1X265_CROS5|nr:hypothetical protein cce_4879 [Crocosphaera subtropica ATCC 51142]
MRELDEENSQREKEFYIRLIQDDVPVELKML